MTPQRSDPSHGAWAGALAGLLALATALGIGELVAALVRPGASPVVAVGETVIDLAPATVKEFAIRVFGVYDKPVLVAGILVVVGLLAAGLGVRARRSTAQAVAGVVGLGLVGAVAAASRPDGGPIDALPALAGAAAGTAALLLLVRPLAHGRVAGGEVDARADATVAGIDRREFVRTLALRGAGAVAVAAVAGGAGRALVRPRQNVTSSRTSLALPAPASPAPPIPAGADLDVPGLGRFVTTNADFYRVDTSLLLPQVPADKWTLRVHGMVSREIRLTYEELLRRPMVERDITLACVSNEVGGPYVGNARWLGIRLADLLREAGVDPRADQILSRSADGWTCGTPTEVVMDGRDALLAVAMNGDPLPVAHGFPARMVVPGLYGYVSATKWVVDLELTRFDRVAAYWAQRGWAEQAPIKTMSRIDTPRPGARPSAGRVAVAGVAWAQHRGIERVEVRVDGGPWRRARLAAVPSLDTWRQWVYVWDATPGSHRLEARATDGTGRTQTGVQRPPVPDGATGWHSVDVDVD
ncbi:MAG: molybdopterin-dependent oxidoreductase [Streptosporangiales bacterium]|nr:molybdopterin-dependent oxidoreductase [Streptosporangiales bacterium]